MLHEALSRWLDAPGTAVSLGEPVDERDLLESLAVLHSLHLAPIGVLGDRARLQHHPVVSHLKLEMEERFLADLSARTERWLGQPPAAGAAGAVATIRAMVREDLVPPVYDWLADKADADELVEFLALEGGPDAGFDDLVAICQVGLDGEPKLELATNYWDEMGNGRPEAVHTNLYHRLVAELALPRPPSLPVEVLRRSTLTAVLATNRWLQPEMVGALGTIEMQAGPRCRKVIKGLERNGFGEEALAFYREHAVADPRHGKDWLDRVITPLANDPLWADGMVRGAAWRCAVNREMFAILVPAPALLASAA